MKKIMLCVETSPDPIPRRSRFERDERGSAVVEFSVVLSLLMFLVLGAISFGVVLARGQVLQQASGEAARSVSLALGADPNVDPQQVAVAAIRRYLDDPSACAAPSAVSCPVDAASPCGAAEGTATCVRVTIRHDRNVDSIVGRLPIVDRFLPETLDASSSTRIG